MKLVTDLTTKTKLTKLSTKESFVDFIFQEATLSL